MKADSSNFYNCLNNCNSSNNDICSMIDNQTVHIHTFFIHNLRFQVLYLHILFVNHHLQLS